jgi:hypothetical protein
LFAANEYLGKIATSIILGLYVVGSWGQKTYLSRFQNLERNDGA